MKQIHSPNYPQSLRLIRVTAALCLILTACSAPTATLAPSDTPVPTLTATLTSTPAPSATVTWTPEPSATFTATVSPTPTVDFSKIVITSISSQVGGYLVILSAPGLKVPYTILLGGHDYKCTVDPQYADKLFCLGLAKPALDTALSLTLTDPQSKQVVYQSKLTIPSALFAGIKHDGYPDTWCADRGKNVTCEVECRIANGNPCIVASCADACGAYYSVHTCPQDMNMKFSSCSPDQWKQLKSQYGIP